ncbi:hypothetical protein EH228_05315 [Erwinia endophytica]|uniref:hypothetical protein n=1 Tax=Erwinia endophytica TaxID=1563158 RepID=UPI001265FD3E|nr:hypothetical protein [Erwinia endophytica]KAB8312827.1 hypothetical protein EH228_05315 [Erwinia endophytica]
MKLIKSTAVLFLVFFSCNSQSSEQIVNDSVRSYIYSSGKPHKLRSVYGVELPDEGFDSFFIYSPLTSGDIDIYPFIYFDEKTKKSTGDSYTRCDVAISHKSKVLIAPRVFSLDDAKKYIPCVGFDNSNLIVKNKSGSWIIVNAVYQGMSDAPEIVPEVYSFDGERLCYEGKYSLDLASNKISIKELRNKFIISHNDDGCSK